jgi:hypothetical protein
MRKFLKFALLSALVVCVGLPVAFALFVAAMALFGVVIGIGSAIVGLILAALKFALMIVLPIAIVWFVVKRLMAPERTY